MKILKFALTLTVFTGSILYADLDEPTFSQETNPPEKDAYPFTIEADGNIVAKSKFKNSGLEGQHLKFDLVNVDASMIFYHNECKMEGAYFDIGYTSTLLGWKENPYFSENKFDTINLSVGASSKRLCGWHWLAQATAHIDIVDDFSFADYTYYDMILWGRYAYCHGIGLNLGFIVQTGMKIDHFYPIIGVDWQVNKNWKINAVLPVNISVVYLYDECWSLALAARTFDVRHRVQKDEPLSRGLFTYRNIGCELVLKYDCESRIVADIHMGYTTGGTLKIANRHYEQKRHFKFEGAPYGGAEVLLKF